MNSPASIRIGDYDYELPADRIAGYPVEGRDLSKLLVYDQGRITQTLFRDLPAFLTSGSTMILNNTRVVEARLLFRKKTGASIEVFCLEPHPRYKSLPDAFSRSRSVAWKCLVGNAAAWTPGLVLQLPLPGGHLLSAELAERAPGYFYVNLSWTTDQSFAEVLHDCGHVPLPPYIKRQPEAADASSYQTLYAHNPGSVAAPTAGLHFTPTVFETIAEKGIPTDYITLHVGAGTFMPVKSDTMADHTMHAEFVEIKRSLIENLIAGSNAPVIAVGTTTVRTLESLYWLGVKLSNDAAPGDGLLEIHQWFPYQQQKAMDVRTSLGHVLDYMTALGTETLPFRTRLLIAPPYEFRMVKGLVTNFHQPRSTLLLLVAAFIGNDWRRVYSYALANNFRFLSYGDACLLLR